MKPHKICIILLPISLFVMLLAINSSFSDKVYTIGLLMTIGEFVYLLGYLCGIFKEKDDRIKFKSNKRSDKEKEKDSDDLLSLSIRMIVYTIKYCECKVIDEATRVKIRKFIIKKDPKHLSYRLKELDDLFSITSGTNISSIDIFLLCEKTNRRLSRTHNPSLIYSCQNFILDILFTAVYQTNKYTYILEDISKNLGAHFLFKSIRQEYEKKYNAETEAKRDNDNKNETEENTEDYLNSQFMTLTLKLLAQAMKVDRSKMVCELDIIKAFIQRYDEKNFQERMSEVKKYLKFDYKELAVEETCKSINDTFSQEYKKREEILKLLIDLIYADETCTNEENIFLEKIAKKLNVSSSSFDFMRMKYENRKKQNEKQDKKQGKEQKSNKDQRNRNQNSSQHKFSSELEKAYAALGIDKDASDKEIRACWRNQIRVNHPDLMESKGAEAVMKATVKCQELNKAFEIVKASRGMK